MWERGWSFIKKAGTVILLSTIFIWFTQGFGFENGSFGMVEDMENSLLAGIGRGISWLFIPLGWGDWKAAVAAVSGLVAKENVVGTFGILYGFARWQKTVLRYGGHWQAASQQLQLTLSWYLTFCARPALRRWERSNGR